MLKLRILCYTIVDTGGDKMDIISIIAMVVFLLPGLIGVLKRKRYGLFYALISVVALSVLIAGFNVLVGQIYNKFSSIESFYLQVIKITRYNKLIMDEVVIPFFQPIFGTSAAPFIYFSTLGVYLALSLLASIFRRKRKKREEK